MINIKVDDAEVRTLLNRIRQRVANADPLMRNIAGIMHDAVEENFAAGGRPAWTPSQRVLKSGGQTLIKSHELANSIMQKSTGMQAVVGTNKIYAAIHQFGGKAGRGRKVTIPARPFLKLTEGDLLKIRSAIVDYLSKI